MGIPEFPLEQTSQNLTQLGNIMGQRSVSGPYVEPARAEGAPAAAYDRLLDYRRILVCHKMTVLSFVTLGLVAAILISLLETPIYRARTSLEIQDFNENFLDMRSVDPANSVGNYPTAESYVETQVKILQSESLLGRVVSKLNLQETPSATGRGLKSRVRHMLGLSSPSLLPKNEELIRQAERNLTIRVPVHTRLLEVLYESADPKLAAVFANTLVSEFVEQGQEMRWQSTQHTAEWLTSHLDEMKAKLEQSEAQLQDYARTSGLTVTSETDKDNAAEMRLMELQDELSKALADRIDKEAKLEEANSKPADSLPEVLDDPTLREYRVKLTDVQRQLVELSTTLTPEHYKVQRVQAQIDELESAIKTERGNVLRRLSNEYAAALRREALLAKAHADQERIVADHSSKSIHYNMLKREVDSSRQLYESMQQRVKQASLATAMRTSNVVVVDPAKPPLQPYKPNLMINLTMGLFSGVFVGVGFAVLLERLDHKIRTPGDVLTYLNLPELGVIPLDEPPASRHIPNGSHARRILTPKSRNELVSSRGDCAELATWQRKSSLIAECARTTLMSVLLPGQNGDHPRVLVITSPSPGDGKTTVATNLSIAMAEIRQKVLLIDGDLRRPRLNKLFGVSTDWGLGDTLRAGTALETTPIMDLVYKTKVSGLYLLPGGRSPINASILLNSPRMSALLGRLRTEFDMVVVDAPPLMHLADARVLGRLSDGVILVIRAGQSSIESVFLAGQRFAEDGTFVLGGILNGWNPNESPGYGYAYGYGGKY
jgi:succinoglycan biosynthesis transport protein ExoP